MRRIVPITYSIAKENNNNHNNNIYHENISTTTTRPRSRLIDKENLIFSRNSSTKHGIIIMPRPEKQQPPPLHVRPALVPSVAGKSSNRTPLTPRIVGTSIASSTPINPTALRRAPRPAETNGTPFVAQKRQEIYAPVDSTLISDNITPRSGSRRSRIESPNTTPTAMPTPVAPILRLADPQRGTDEPRAPSVTFAPAIHHRSQQDLDSKFCFASDAKVSAPQKPISQAKPSTFFYANGDSIPPVIKSSGSTVGSSIGDDRASSAFFHANDMPDISSNHSSGSSIMAARMATPRLATNTTHPPRPTSLSKSHSHAPASQTTPAHVYPASSRPTSSSNRTQSSQSVVASRRISLDLRRPHERTASIGTLDFTPPGRHATPRSSTDASPATSLNFSSIVTVATPEGRMRVKEENTELGSPIRAGGTLEQMNELAAEARRDRKVLDLEITNSSLEAINRTIERQLRKQTAELRRYRRLSRSGRLSLADSSAEYSMAGMDGADLSDMSEGEEEYAEEMTSGEDSMDDGSLSPSAMAASDARHRQRDERRLRIDLSKHQQLIANSQAMNHSIKRCLAWSEELIVEARKALAYSVRPSDVLLGGRVLAPDEAEVDDSEGLSEIGARLAKAARQRRQASLSPSTASSSGASRRGGGEWADRGGAADRDSGIEIASYRGDSSAYVVGMRGDNAPHAEHPHPAPP